jgi:hypothetical protein
MRSAIAVVTTACLASALALPNPAEARIRGFAIGGGAGLALGILGGMALQHQFNRPCCAVPSRGGGSRWGNKRYRPPSGGDSEPAVTDVAPAAPTSAPRKASPGFQDLPVRPSGPTAFDALPQRPAAAPVTFVYTPTPAPWQFAPTDANVPLGSGLDRALQMFIARARDVGLRSPRLTQIANVRIDVMTAYETSRLKPMTQFADTPWSDELLQALIVARAADFLPEAARGIAATDGRADVEIDGLFARASHAAWLSAIDLNEAIGLTNSIDRFNKEFGRRFGTSGYQTPPRVIVSIAASSAALDSQFDRQGFGLSAKARLRRALFDCATERLSVAIQNVDAQRVALNAGTLDDAVAREVTFACKEPAVAELSKPRELIMDPIPVNATWSVAEGFRVIGGPGVATAH